MTPTAPIPDVVYRKAREYEDLLPEFPPDPGDWRAYRPRVNLCDYWDYLYGIQEEAVSAWRGKRVPPLRRLSVFLTDLCNLNCGYCTRDQKAVQTMDTRWLVDNLTIAREMGAIFLDVMGLGEPTLIDDLPGIMLQASELGFVNTLGTNGATPNLSNPDYVQKLLSASPLKFRVSLDSAVPEIHNHMRGDQDTWHQAVQFIQEITRRREKESIQAAIFVNQVVTADTFQNIPRDLAFFADLGVDDVHLIPVRYQSDQFLSVDQIQFFNERIAPRIRSLGRKYHMAWARENAFIFGESAEELSLSSRGIYYIPTTARHCYALKAQVVLDPLHQPYTCLWGKRAGGKPVGEGPFTNEDLSDLRERLMKVNYLEINPWICAECCTKEIISVNNTVQKRLRGS